MTCPKCGCTECWRVAVDIGVGVMHGPYGCPACGWSESQEYDLSDGKDPIAADGSVTDQFGVHYPAKNSVADAYRMARDAEKKSVVGQS